VEGQSVVIKPMFTPIPTNLSPWLVLHDDCAGELFHIVNKRIKRVDSQLPNCWSGKLVVPSPDSMKCLQ